MENKKRLILDVDTGSDDAVAIILAVLGGRFDIAGLTVTHGNRPVEACVKNTLCVLELLGVADKIPVYPGCPQPMTKNLSEGRCQENDISITVDGREYSIHPESFPLPAPKTEAQRKHACTFLMEEIEASPEKVTVVAVGPPTNVGMALRMKPSLVDNIDEIVLMGGSVNMGNITPACEANFFHDPDAAKIILESGARVVVVGLNATHSAELSLEDADTIEAVGTDAARFIAYLIRMRVEAGVKLGWGNGRSDAIHDALAVAAAMDESVITELVPEKCDVSLGDKLIDGQLVVNHRLTGGDFKTLVAYRADKDRFLGMILDALKSVKA